MACAPFCRANARPNGSSVAPSRISASTAVLLETSTTMATTQLCSRRRLAMDHAAVATALTTPPAR
jgi:hypothetical protein